MTPRVACSGFLSRLRAAWRCQRGIAVLELIGLGLLFASAYAGYQVLTKKVPSLQAALIPLKQCQTIVKSAVDGINQQFGEFDPATQKFNFPAGLEIPGDHPAAVALQSCKTELDKFSEAAKQGNHKAIGALSDQIDAGLKFVGQCAITSTFRVGTAGVAYKDSLEAHIPFSSSGQATGTIAATGAAAGGGGFRKTQGTSWIGDVSISAAASQNAGGGQSQVTVTATAPALAPRNDDNSCYGASVEDGGRCVFIVRQDGTCQAGLIPVNGRCFISCTTPPVAIQWKAPPPASIVTFFVSPNTIDKGSVQPVFLQALVSNAKSVSIDRGIGDVGPVDPTNAAQTVGPVPLKTLPDANTTWTITAVGANGAAVTKTATLTVKDNTPPGVAITSPTANELVLDSGVTVSGVIKPVPDPAFRKAQILVNGAFLSEATINDAGQFSARTALMNTIGLNDVTVFGAPSVGVTSCGPRAAEIVVGANPPNGAKNLIQVIVPLASGSATSSVQVQHAITVNQFSVSWGGGCGAAPAQNNALGSILTTDLPLPVGSVLCGFSSPINCSDVATITIGTSVGSKVVTQSWSANITSCN